MTILDTRNMPKRKALYDQIMELEGSKLPHQKIVDNYNIDRRFFPRQNEKGTDNWEIAAEARAEIRAIDKKIEPLVRKMRNTFE